MNTKPIYVPPGAMTPTEITQMERMFGLKAHARPLGGWDLVREKAEMVPLYGHLRSRSRVQRAINQLSGIAYPDVDGGVA